MPENRPEELLEDVDVQNAWEIFVDENKKDLPLLLLHEDESFGTEALFSFEVSSISFKEPVKEDKEEDTPERFEMAGLLDTLVTALNPGWSLEFVFGGNKKAFSWRAFANVYGKSTHEAKENAYSLYRDVSAASVSTLDAFRLQPVRIESSMGQAWENTPYFRAVRPRYIELEVATPDIGFSTTSSEKKTNRQTLRIPVLKLMPNEGIIQLNDVFAVSSAQIRMRYKLTKVELTPESIAFIEKIQQLLKKNKEKTRIINDAHRPSVNDDAAYEILEEQLACWMRRHAGVRFETTLYSDAPVSTAMTKIVAERLLYPHIRFSGTEGADNSTHITVSDEGMLDLRRCLPMGFPLPPVLPSRADLRRAIVSKNYNVTLPNLADEGIVLGEAEDNVNTDLVRFKPVDRNRHCYIIGATGTGKSTLLANMIVQDMQNGEGLTLIDPHGDLFTEVLKALPPKRFDDLILINPSREDKSVGINFLECSSERSDVEVHFIINEIMNIFRLLYLAEYQGPVFETYMRTGLQLLLEQDSNTAPTLLDIPRLFEDELFRDRLISSCRNEEVARYWKKTVLEARGDWSLTNMTGYITSKLNQFVYNNVMRKILCCPKTTINFRHVLDTRKILLINLSKGFLGEINAKFLGMIVLGKLFAAALSRTDSAQGKRVPHYLYVDEFQNFTTGTMAQMMAEARKYELRMILANQNLGQLRPEGSGSELLEAILGNVASIFAFRTGVHDAIRIENYLKPNYSDLEIQYLPDFHVIARMLIDGQPCKPFVLKTPPPPKTIVPKGLAEAAARAYEKYCV